MYKKILKFSLVAVLGMIVSCQKETITKPNANPDINKGTANELSLLENDPWLKKMMQDNNEYMLSRPLFDMNKLPQVLKEISKTHDKTSAVWGVGSDDKVWKWNGSSWFEPNSAARLKFVDVSEYGGGNAVWGIGNDNRVWKWNGSSWGEPNSAARLYQISAFDAGVAIGMGTGGTIYITMDGGLSWSTFTSITNVMYLSVGNSVSNFCYVVQLNSGTYKLYNYDYPTSTWNYNATPSVPQSVAAIWAGGAWYIENSLNYKIFKATSNGGTFTEPNSAAGLHQISAYGGVTNAWGIGGSNRIFTTTNGGTSWSEPNSAARLRFVSAGYE